MITDLEIMEESEMCAFLVDDADSSSNNFFTIQAVTLWLAVTEETIILKYRHT